MVVGVSKVNSAFSDVFCFSFFVFLFFCFVFLWMGVQCCSGNGLDGLGLLL